MRTLQAIWNELYLMGYETDKGSVHSYIPIYEEILAPYREAATNVLEIGLFNGNSLRLWKWYFLVAEVHGIDCDEQPHGGLADLRPIMAEGLYDIRIMDATDVAKVNKEFGGVKFDVIIEDAGHAVEQQVSLYNVFKNFLSVGGVYIIEDIQNIDADRSTFENIDKTKKVNIIDRRKLKFRYDDVVCVITDL